MLGSPFVQDELRTFIKVRLDVTEIHQWQKFLDQRLGVSAVPSAVVLDAQGRRIPQPIIGENVSLRAVRAVLRAALAD